MLPYMEYSLDQRAQEFVKARLASGNTLSQLVLSLCKLDDGQVITLLPIDTDMREIYQFDVGGKLISPLEHISTTCPGMYPIPNTDPWLTNVIWKYLEIDDRHLCIVEDTIARPGDPVLNSSLSRVKTFQNEVYHVITRQSNSQQPVESAFRQAKTSLDIVSFLTSEPQPNWTLDRQTQITVDQLHKLATGTEHLIVGVYDGESYLIWSVGANMNCVHNPA